MARAAEVRRGDGQPSHRGGADRGGSGAAGECVETDETQSGPHGKALEDRPKSALNDPGEDGDLQSAQDQQVDEAGGDERLLELRRDPLPDTEDHAEEHGCVRRGQRGVEGRDVSGAQPGGQC